MSGRGMGIDWAVRFLIERELGARPFTTRVRGGMIVPDQFEFRQCCIGVNGEDGCAEHCKTPEHIANLCGVTAEELLHAYRQQLAQENT